MYDKKDLYAGLTALGIEPSDTVMMHSSYKSLGGYTGTPEDFLTDLCGFFTSGLLVIPTHTWGSLGEPPRFDRQRSKTCIGLLPDTCLSQPGFFRSCNPTHSVAAYGDGAEEFASGEENIATPCPRNGCHGKLLDRNGKILFLGCDPKHNTFIHACEEWLGVKGRLDEQPSEISVTDGGETRIVSFRRHTELAGIVCENYGRVAELLEKAGKARRGKICAADCLALYCKDIYELCEDAVSRDIDLFAE